MKEFTIGLPPGMVTETDAFVGGHAAYCSRSEFVRHAVREKLDREKRRTAAPGDGLPGEFKPSADDSRS
jgi:Arc/MetJ-type ribon-helix-helix transcriptional regulator